MESSAAPDKGAVVASDAAKRSRGIFVPAMADASRRRVAIWYFAIAGLVALMVLVGGLTRLTDSGLSITEWRPVTGVMPPLTEAGWQAELEKYRQIPEYQLINKGMSLAEFKVIYYWEWGHRLLGRIVGIAFLIPFLYFLVTRQFDRRTALISLGLFTLGGLQGFIGWFMVQSGLTERVDVSQYRLALHLGLAVAIFAALVRAGMGLWPPDERRARLQTAPKVAQAAGIFALLVYGQILLGAFVAGIDAGLASTTWPLMNGALVPAGLWELSPAWRNLTENPLTVQFIHRLGGYAVLAAAVALWIYARRSGVTGASRRPLDLVLAGTFAQAVLGIATVLAAVPIWLAALHQIGALVVLTAAIWAAFALKPRPADNAAERGTGTDQVAASA